MTFAPQTRALEGAFTFLPIEDVYYGPGSLASLGPTLARHGVSRALLITGRTLATKSGLVERVLAAAQGRIAAVFDGTLQHVHRPSVLDAIEQARSLGADGVVTFGGGTPNDTGKAVLLGLAGDVDDISDFDHWRVRFEYPDKVEIPSLAKAALPMFALSTTLSGGEFTHFTGITDSDRQVKDLYIDKALAARAVILDATLTLDTPEWLWLSTGIRAVDHCVEALCSINAHPFTDALAARALAMLDRSLRACHNDGTDIAARTEAHLAAWMSVCGLANVNLGLSHGIGHQLGARNDVPHGITSCVMMAPTMDFNAEHVGDRQAWIAEILGREVDPGGTELAAATGRGAIRELVADLGLPRRLRDVGVTRNDFPALARDAMEDMIVATNPRPVDGIEDVIAVLESAW